MKRIFELFVLIQIFLCSHSVTWNLWLTDRAAQLLFLFSSFLLFYQRSTKNNTHSIQFKKNLWISGGVTVWVLLNVLLFNTDIVDMPASRRVEIKFRLKEDEMIQKITEVLNQ